MATFDRGKAATELMEATNREVIAAWNVMCPAAMMVADSTYFARLDVIKAEMIHREIPVPPLGWRIEVQQ